jgi:FAD/FMN-containing dehydrogenase
LGEVIRPHNPAYDQARHVWNAAIDRYPAMIVRPADALDVARTVEFARTYDLPLAIRSGGHSFAGYGTLDNGVVIDFSNMRGVALDPERHNVWAEPGVNTNILGPQAGAHGLALPTGDVGSVGLGGLTLGGGIGWLVRKHGLTIDHLQSVEMVTAEGRIITASQNEHSDLFWAVRGGGGNFGVVTGFEFDLPRVGQILGGALVLPPTKDVLQGYLSYALAAPEELTTIAMMMAAPPLPMIPAAYHGKMVLMVMLVYSGDDLDAGQRAIAPLRDLAEPIADIVAPMPYHGIYALTAAGEAAHPSAARSGFFDELDDDALDAIISGAEAAPGPGAMVQFRPLGGAMARVGARETAFAHRQRNYMVTMSSPWMSPEGEGAARGWLESIWAELRSKANGVYANFLGDEGDARIRQAYPGATYERLVAVKRQYDPTNAFKLNQNIKP